MVIQLRGIFFRGDIEYVCHSPTLLVVMVAVLKTATKMFVFTIFRQKPYSICSVTRGFETKCENHTAKD